MSQFYRIYHPGSEAEAPKLADIEANGGLVIAAQPELAFMIGWTLEHVLKKLIQYDFKFVVRRGAIRTPDFVTVAPSPAAREASRKSVQVCAKRVKAAKPVQPTNRAEPEVLKLNTMSNLPKIMVVMGKKINEREPRAQP